MPAPLFGSSIGGAETLPVYNGGGIELTKKGVHVKFQEIKRRKVNSSDWMGIGATFHASYAQCGVMHGSFPLNRSHATAEIRASAPNGWAFAVGGMGFDVAVARVTDVLFASTLRDVHPNAKFLSSTRGSSSRSRLRASEVRADMVFTDLAGLPSPASGYWKGVHTPHMVFWEHVHQQPVPAPDWELHSSSFPHVSVGGSTTATWCVGVLSRAHDRRFDVAVPQFQLPWAPVSASLDESLWAEEIDQVPVVTPAPQPLWKDSTLIPAGLFPHDALNTKVFVPARYSKSHVGRRPLAPHELAKLWDVPILYLDSLEAGVAPKVLPSFVNSAPVKILQRAGNILLANFYRGGSSAAKPQASTAAPRPVDNETRATLTATDNETRVDNETSTQHSDDIPSPPSPVSPSSTSPPYPSMDDASNIIKQDGQKADDAMVQTTLWDHAFYKGWRSKFDGIQDKGGHILPTFGSSSLTWQEGLNVLRRWSMCWWRARVRKSFLAWANKMAPSTVSHAHSRVMVSVVKDYCAARQQWVHVYSWSKNGQHEYRREYHRKRDNATIGSSWEPAIECILRADASDWWEWLGGSRLFFWRWPPEDVEWARDGQPHYLMGELPTFTKPQKKPKTDNELRLMRQKVVKVRKRGYIEAAEVLSLSHMFPVPKGDDDIRMVYNGSSCGLNEQLWAPHFGLPTVTHTLRSLEEGFFQADLDIGEMFLNFTLHEELRKFSGVDITHMRSDDLADQEWESQRVKRWERWCRNWMGLRDSPYRSLQMLLKAKAVAYGDRHDASNPFQWNKVILNLPGSSEYMSGKPWVQKVKEGGKVASDCFIYVDDGRGTGDSAENCWLAIRRIASVCNHLGIQDAARKRTAPSRRPGPWAGTVVHTEEGVEGTVSQEKWEKAQGLVLELYDMLSCEEGLSVKRLEEIRGFLNYLARTYRWMAPYLKGLHLTIDIWRPGRDAEGWKLSRFMMDRAVHKGEDYTGVEERPARVFAVPRLHQDVTALLTLTEVKAPPMVKYRVKGSLVAWYMAGDASGKGFGAAVWDDKTLKYQAGTWSCSIQEESSNFREAENLVIYIEQQHELGALAGREMFVFTDNQVFEGCYYKGHSVSSKLSEIILRLRKVERDAGLILHVIHISGKRMKASGIDGLSRGDMLEGMMAGVDPLTYLPLNQDAHERSDGEVTKWIHSWWKEPDGTPWGGVPLQHLSPEDWFQLSDIKAPRLWTPPPAAMEAVMELFNEDRIVNPHFPHVFAIPRLMTHLWRKALSRDADVLFTVQTGDHFWKPSQFEPLIVVIVLPLTHIRGYHGPWVVRGTQEGRQLERRLTNGFKIHRGWKPPGTPDVERELRRVWENPNGRSRDLLLEFLTFARKFPPVQECVVRGLLSGRKARLVPETEERTGGRKRRSERGGGRGGRQVLQRT